MYSSNKVMLLNSLEIFFIYMYIDSCYPWCHFVFSLLLFFLLETTNAINNVFTVNMTLLTTLCRLTYTVMGLVIIWFINKNLRRVSYWLLNVYFCCTDAILQNTAASILLFYNVSMYGDTFWCISPLLGRFPLD